MSHQIEIDNFLDWEHESIIASSSEGKRLIVKTFINASGELISYFVIKTKSKTLGYIEKSRQLLINMAIEDYNNI